MEQSIKHGSLTNDNESQLDLLKEYDCSAIDCVTKTLAKRVRSVTAKAYFP